MEEDFSLLSSEGYDIEDELLNDDYVEMMNLEDGGYEAAENKSYNIIDIDIVRGAVTAHEELLLDNLKEYLAGLIMQAAREGSLLLSIDRDEEYENNTMITWFADIQNGEIKRQLEEDGFIVVLPDRESDLDRFITIKWSVE